VATVDRERTILKWDFTRSSFETTFTYAYKVVESYSNTPTVMSTRIIRTAL